VVERAREKVREKAREEARVKARERMGEREKEKARGKAREKAREEEVEKEREKVKKERTREKVKRAMKRRVAIVFGASQPTLALGRKTSKCHAGQDWCGRFTSDSSGEPGLLGQLSRSLELLCLAGSLALGLAEHAVPLRVPHLGCLTRPVLYPGGYQALLLPAGSMERPHSRIGSSTW
jgi:hypothetical protein